jgi:hypothetical protein
MALGLSLRPKSGCKPNAPKAPRLNSVNFLSRNKADILLLGVAAVWGSSYLATKVLTDHGSVFAILSARFLIASVIMLVVWLFTSNKRLDRRGFLIGVFFGLTQAGILSLETWGVKLTSATNADFGISVAQALAATELFHCSNSCCGWCFVIGLGKWIPHSQLG